MSIWQGQQIRHSLRIQDDLSFTSTGLSIDTRTLKPGDLFIAIEGARFDGHDFVGQAFAKGAVAALVHKPGLSVKGPLICVPNTLKALETLALTARENFTGKILALTGSVGKTTIKEGLSHVLSAQRSTFASYGSFNNHLGLSLSLARLPADDAYAIFELGMNHSGEIASLVSLLRPHVTMVANVSYQHGINFAHSDDIVKAKGEIFSLTLSGIGIIGRDSPEYEALKTLGDNQKIRHWITFGSHQEACIRLVQVTPQETAIEVTILYNYRPYTYTLPNLGDHWISNSLAILAGVVAMGGHMDLAVKALPRFTPVAGRGQLLDIKGIKVIDESYNAAPAAMMAALRAFACRPCSGKKYVVLGEMVELGHQTDFYHEALYEPLTALNAQGIWLCGPTMKNLSLRLCSLKGHADTIDLLIPHIVSDLSPADMVLVKGARSTKTFKVIDALYRHHGEIEQAEAYPLKPYLTI